MEENPVLILSGGCWVRLEANGASPATWAGLLRLLALGEPSVDSVVAGTSV